MLRELPSAPMKPDLSPGRTQGRSLTTRSFDFEVITPMFGGGALTREQDEHYLIRGSAVRGHLRFWWRATRGMKFTHAQSLRQEEIRIWGGSSSASQVRISVQVLSRGEDEHPNDRNRSDGRTDRPNPKLPAYALFPFMPESGQRNHGKARPAAAGRRAVKFRLYVSCPVDVWQDVEAALWGWSNFGGIGARTRRGCGALFCAELAPALKNGCTYEDLIRWYQTQLVRYVPNQEHGGLDVPRDWPTLPATLLAKAVGNSDQAWSVPVQLLADFRQKPDFARGPKSDRERGGRPGRSHWPEADSLRRMLKLPPGVHSRSITTDFNVFPRAELGLPIVFHFKDGASKGDPAAGITIYPVGSSGLRMASPLLLRPLRCSLNGAATQHFALVVRLRAPSVDEISFESGSQTMKAFIRDKRAAEYPKSPLKEYSPSGSSLAGFIEYAKKAGFQ